MKITEISDRMDVILNTHPNYAILRRVKFEIVRLSLPFRKRNRLVREIDKECSQIEEKTAREVLTSGN